MRTATFFLYLNHCIAIAVVYSAWILLLNMAVKSNKNQQFLHICVFLCTFAAQSANKQ